MRLDMESLRQGMWAEGLVAALATLALGLPLTQLLRDEAWVGPAVALVLLVALIGAVLRTVDAPPSLVSIAQLLFGLGGLLLVYLRETLAFGVLPTRDTLAVAGSLLQQAGTILQTYPAPAPTTEGVSFLVVAVLALTAVSVDSMGVTGRAPASAGIPLAAGFLVSVSNSGQAMQPWFFAAVAALWLVMLAQQGHRIIAAWPSANRHETHGSDNIAASVPRTRGVAQIIGVGALLLAVGGAALLPHMAPIFFGEGLARNPDARGGDGGGAEVQFTETMDPAQDLRNQSQAGVLSYRTDATRLEPLRVTATTDYSDGRWQAPEHTESDLLQPGELPQRPAGMAGDLPLSTRQIQVLGNQLTAPHLALPAPPVQLELSGGTFQYDPQDWTVVAEGHAERYEASYLQLGGQLPDGIGQANANESDFDPAVLEVDPVAADAISDLAEEVTGDARNNLEAAILIQDHLRASPYQYSLTLAPAAEADANDPIGGFLETRQGYCVQFATAMVMMARDQGIPARMALGFLPGTVQQDGTRKVVASDAHTWPELWIDGMGWTRFEPTPGVRSAGPPPYAQANPEEEAEDPSLSAELTSEEATPTQDEEDTAEDERGLLESWWPILWRTGLVLLALLLLAATVPLAGSRYRERELRAAADRGQEVEGHWALLTRSLDDLGVPEPPERSPREMGRYYRGGTVLEASGEQALGRITGTLERSRYAAPERLTDRDTAQLGRDVRTVVDGVRRGSPWNIRANARLLPRSGIAGIRWWLSSLLRR